MIYADMMLIVACEALCHSHSKPDGHERLPARAVSIRPDWRQRALVRLGDLLILAGLKLKGRSIVDRPVAWSAL